LVWRGAAHAPKLGCCSGKKGPPVSAGWAPSRRSKLMAEYAVALLYAALAIVLLLKALGAI